MTAVILALLFAPASSGQGRTAHAADERAFRSAAGRTGDAVKPAAGEGRRAAFQAKAADAPIAAFRPILGAPGIIGDRRSIVLDGQFMTFAQAAALVPDPNALRQAVSNVAQFQDGGSYEASEPEIRRILEEEGIVSKPGGQKPKPPAKPAPGWNGSFASPLRAGVITSPFGADRGDHRHSGLDIASGTGTPILASAPGKVIHAGWLGGYGNLVIVRHGDDTTSYYAHASAYKSKKGDAVRQGATVALVGSTGNSTGPHVHFEIRVGDKPTDPCKRLKRC